MALTDGEIVEIIQGYIGGESLSDISDSLYVSIDRVKSVLSRYGADLKESSANYFNPKALPDRAVTDGHEINDWVWSSKYNALAKVKGKYKDAYRILIANEHRRNAYQPAEELGSLKHLEKIGVNFEKLAVFLTEEEQNHLIAQGLRNHKRKDKK